MKTENENKESVDEQKVEPRFNSEEWLFITQCVAEATIKAKDAATVANILSKLKEKCK